MVWSLRRQKSSPQETSGKTEGLREDHDVVSQIVMAKNHKLNHYNLYWMTRRPTQKSPKIALGGIVGATLDFHSLLPKCVWT